IRAAAAEQRLYSALLDLDRLIANITEIRETERGLVVVLGQGLFASGQSALSPRAREEVRQIATVLTQFPEQRIAVEGHTDSVGSETANQRLSEQRAESVRAALIAEGIDPGRVEMVGYGQSRPIADNATADGRAQNRRVEIVIVGARRPAAMQ
ncbi:MAG: OmpA family protein, partial [Gemmatimonadetes bacterium]|nr:OmpA family protein [Gemmatimonadota bacterium]